MHTRLQSFLTPSSVAVIGATETLGSVGRTLLTNLLASPFGGPVFPVNPKRSSVLGVKSYASLHAVPDPVELAVIAVPAPGVPEVVRQCGELGIPAAVVISAGFREAGPDGFAREQALQAAAQTGGVRLIGPNCLGVMAPHTGLNATFAQTMAAPGRVAFISQSGALLTAILDRALTEKIGFSAVLSLGSMLDIGWADVLDYLAEDDKTESIVLYMESVGDAQSFLAAARAAALCKPVLVIKAGRTAQGAQAAASHTGALTGSDDVLDAAFDQVGVLRVERLADVFALTETLAMQPRPKGRRLTLVTNAGGPGVLATDALIGGGGVLAPLSPEIEAGLSAFLPPHWSHANPVDILGDAGPERYAKALEVAAQDPQSDGLLVVLTPQAMTAPTETAAALVPYAQTLGKPVLAAWMGGASVLEGEGLLAAAGIPTFPYPDHAVRVFNHLWRYSANLETLYETPERTELPDGAEVAARALLAGVAATGRTLLTEAESKALLSAYGIPTVPTYIAASADEAARQATALGYPVVLKLHSETITHKTDVGGVVLNLQDTNSVRATFQEIQSRVPAADFLGVTVQPMIRLKDAYELIVGASSDPQFGPVLLFGAGGQLVEVQRDHALALPPLTTTLAARLIEKPRIAAALKGVRGRAPVDEAALVQLLVRFSRLVADQPLLKEIEINPLLASPDGLLALDARVVLGTRPPVALRSYPHAYETTALLDPQTLLRLRPIRPDDEAALTAFHSALSEQTLLQRYGEALPLSERTARERLRHILFPDYDRVMALVAEAEQTGELLGVARYERERGAPTAELRLVVADSWQSRGVGSRLLESLITVAEAEGVNELTMQFPPENTALATLAERFGFVTTPSGYVRRG